MKIFKNLKILLFFVLFFQNFQLLAMNSGSKSKSSSNFKIGRFEVFDLSSQDLSEVSDIENLENNINATGLSKFEHSQDKTVDNEHFRNAFFTEESDFSDYSDTESSLSELSYEASDCELYSIIETAGIPFNYNSENYYLDNIDLLNKLNSNNRIKEWTPFFELSGYYYTNRYEPSYRAVYETDFGEVGFYGLPKQIGDKYCFKLHLQINPKFLLKFAQDFNKALDRGGSLYYTNILSFKIKVPLYPHSGIFKVEFFKRKMPMVVIYIARPLSVDNFDYLQEDVVTNKDSLRHIYLDSIVNPVNTWLNNWISKNSFDIKDLAFPIPPRFNLKINDLVYIAGGNGDAKEELENSFLPYDITCNYTKDKTFIKNFEYTPNHTFVLDEFEKHKIDLMEEILNQISLLPKVQKKLQNGEDRNNFLASLKYLFNGIKENKIYKKEYVDDFAYKFSDISYSSKLFRHLKNTDRYFQELIAGLLLVNYKIIKEKEYDVDISTILKIKISFRTFLAFYNGRYTEKFKAMLEDLLSEVDATVKVAKFF